MSSSMTLTIPITMQPTPESSVRQFKAALLCAYLQDFENYIDNETQIKNEILAGSWTIQVNW
jgi:hypothetical protein